MHIKQWIKNLVPSNNEERHALVGQQKNWKLKRDFQISFLKSRGLSSHHLLMDIGCGTLRGGIPIIELLEPGHYYGIDVRPPVLVEAQKELVASGLEHKKPVLLLPKDADQHDLTNRFDFVFAFSVLIHMTDDILKDQANFIRNIISPTGSAYANVNIGQRSEGKWDKFPVAFRPMKFYSEIFHSSGLKIESLGTLKELGHFSGDDASDNQHMLHITST